MGYVNSLTVGPAHTLVQNQAYATPGGPACMVHVQGGAAMEQSNDAVSWDAVTLDDDEQFLAGGNFIRSTGVDTIVTLRR